MVMVDTLKDICLRLGKSGGAFETIHINNSVQQIDELQPGRADGDGDRDVQKLTQRRLFALTMAAGGCELPFCLPVLAGEIERGNDRPDGDA